MHDTEPVVIDVDAMSDSLTPPRASAAPAVSAARFPAVGTDGKSAVKRGVAEGRVCAGSGSGARSGGAPAACPGRVEWPDYDHEADFERPVKRIRRRRRPGISSGSDVIPRSAPDLAAGAVPDPRQQLPPKKPETAKQDDEEEDEEDEEEGSEEHEEVATREEEEHEPQNAVKQELPLEHA
jgi:hypothetical protein